MLETLRRVALGQGHIGRTRLQDRQKRHDRLGLAPRRNRNTGPRRNTRNHKTPRNGIAQRIERAITQIDTANAQGRMIGKAPRNLRETAGDVVFAVFSHKHRKSTSGFAGADDGICVTYQSFTHASLRQRSACSPRMGSEGLNVS
jgi:hypothetical protein